MKAASAQVLAPVGVALALAGANLIERTPGSLWSSMTESGFASPRGWPLIAVARANEAGAFEIHASVTHGGTHVARNVFDGPYSHLAWSTPDICANLVFALVAVLATGWIARRYVRTRRGLLQPPDHDAGTSGQ